MYDFEGSLDDEDIAVFEEFGTTNFEVVWAKLRDGTSLTGVLGRTFSRAKSGGFDSSTVHRTAC